MTRLEGRKCRKNDIIVTKYGVKNNNSVVILRITTINNIGDICLPSLGITMVSVISVIYDQ